MNVSNTKGSIMTHRFRLSALLVALAMPVATLPVAALAQTAATTPAATAAAAAPAAAPATGATAPAAAAAVTAAPPATGTTTGTATTTPPGPAISAASGLLPTDLSVRGMFLHADIVVQVVMVGLLLASVVTWTILITKTFELSGARRVLRQSITGADQDRTLSARRQRLGAERGPGEVFSAAAFTEIQLSAGTNTSGTKERIASRLHRLEITYMRRATRGTGILATIGSTSPFVGLFGTVWGIMNSFVGISHAQSSSLAVVAPGIAEALLATATGLVAAIPAVVVYNVFARATGGYRADLATLAAVVERLASRELDLPRAVRAEAA
jgi:biopolymer transport protein ExbB